MSNLATGIKTPWGPAFSKESWFIGGEAKTGKKTASLLLTAELLRAGTRVVVVTDLSQARVFGELQKQLGGKFKADDVKVVTHSIFLDVAPHLVAEGYRAVVVMARRYADPEIVSRSVIWGILGALHQLATHYDFFTAFFDSFKVQKKEDHFEFRGLPNLPHQTYFNRLLNFPLAGVFEDLHAPVPERVVWKSPFSRAEGFNTFPILGAEPLASSSLTVIKGRAGGEVSEKDALLATLLRFYQHHGKAVAVCYADVDNTSIERRRLFDGLLPAHLFYGFAKSKLEEAKFDILLCIEPDKGPYPQSKMIALHYNLAAFCPKKVVVLSLPKVSSLEPYAGLEGLRVFTVMGLGKGVQYLESAASGEPLRAFTAAE